MLDQNLELYYPYKLDTTLTAKNTYLASALCLRLLTDPGRERGLGEHCLWLTWGAM